MYKGYGFTPTHEKKIIRSEKINRSEKIEIENYLKK